MSEWWTYRLSDFLMFTASTYYRLFELSNREWWPLHLLLLTLGLCGIAAALRRHISKPIPGWVPATLLAVIWVWVAWEFHWKRYTPINLAAPYFAGLFVLQAIALVAVGRGARKPPPAVLPGRLGMALTIFGLLVQPLIGTALGRPLVQLQVFGIAPDPTVVATIGFLFLFNAGWLLFLAPLCWLLASAATLYTLESPEAWVILAVFVLTVGGLIARRRDRSLPSSDTP